MKIFQKMYLVFVAFLVVTSIGVTGYVFIEHWPAFDALYMTIITIFTVGYSETHPMHTAGRTFTIFLILFGWVVVAYGISTITAMLVEGELTDALRRRKMDKKIGTLHGHYIVCGGGQTGHFVIDELQKTLREFVVIERDSARITALIEQGVLCIEGDATQDHVLQAARVEHAAGLVSVLDTDAINLFVALTARRLNPTLRIVAKCVEEESELKLRMVGANRVVMPNRIGGLRLVSELIRPSVTSFLDEMLREKDLTIRLDEIEVVHDSQFIGMTLQQTGCCDVEGVTVVALKESSTEKFHYNPPKNTMLHENSVIIVMGNETLIKEMRHRALLPVGDCLH